MNGVPVIVCGPDAGHLYREALRAKAWLGSEVIRRALQGRWPAGKNTQQGLFKFS